MPASPWALTSFPCRRLLSAADASLQFQPRLKGKTLLDTAVENNCFAAAHFDLRMRFGISKYYLT